MTAEEVYLAVKPAIDVALALGLLGAFVLGLALVRLVGN